MGVICGAFLIIIVTVRINDHRSSQHDKHHIIMTMFEILSELSKCVIKKRNEHMLLEKCINKFASCRVAGKLQFVKKEQKTKTTHSVFKM
jgi:hypothetical protein